ncbi:MAG: hypothetical protein QMC89_05405 [Candidatus Hodarchaeaceae archaeon]|nr:hypothetical protein [Candidatus Hodarchaeaceae archaeon]
MIAKEIDSTYAHTLKVLSNLKKRGLVSFERRGRVKQVKLTELGERAAEILAHFIDTVRLSEVGAKIEEVYEKKIKGREPGGIDRAAVSKRLAPYERELRLSIEKNPAVREQAEGLLTRIKEILESIK